MVTAPPPRQPPTLPRVPSTQPGRRTRVIRPGVDPKTIPRLPGDPDGIEIERGDPGSR